jgi:shikimate dehydrogenase
LTERDLRLAVIGDPIAHSRSPVLYRRFLAEARLGGSYEAIRVEAGDGARAIDALRAEGYTGLNVTTPLKEEAFARADLRDASALASGSVNTLVFGERIVGTNTDGIGALGGLGDAGLTDPAGARVLILGAGPTARAAAAALVAAGAAVFVWNRTQARAERVARELGAHVFEAGLRFDAVLSALLPNAVPADDRVRTIVLVAPIIVDANYGERATLGAALGRPVSDGTSMLEHSARASFAAFCSAA